MACSVYAPLSPFGSLLRPRLHLVAAVRRDLLADDAVVLAQHLQPPLVAEALGHLRRALDIAEENRHCAVGGGVPAQIGMLVLHAGGDDIEAAQQYELVQAFTPQLPEDLGQRVAAVQIDVPIGADDKHAAGGKTPGQVLEQDETRFVGPVSIVEDKEERRESARLVSHPP